jgi:tRNA (mo5U34)-methyltransferase
MCSEGSHARIRARGQAPGLRAPRHNRTLDARTDYHPERAHLTVVGPIRRALRGSKRISPELAAEVGTDPAWMYPWSLSRGVVTPVLDPELPSIHATRAELIEGRVREALADAGPQASALDLACNEGWFSHRLLDWGAARVVGVDIRGENIRRAELIRQHFGVARDRLELIEGDAYELQPERYGAFDVVLLLGLVYHVENPMGLIRLAYALTRSLCVIESQLTRQTDPIVHGWGTSEQWVSADGSFAARIESDSEGNPLASATGVLSLIPNRVALEQMARLAGFTKLEFGQPDPRHNPQYVAGDRAVLLAWRTPS